MEILIKHAHNAYVYARVSTVCVCSNKRTIIITCYVLLLLF